MWIFIKVIYLFILGTSTKPTVLEVIYYSSMQYIYQTDEIASYSISWRPLLIRF